MKDLFRLILVILVIIIAVILIGITVIFAKALFEEMTASRNMNGMDLLYINQINGQFTTYTEIEKLNSIEVKSLIDTINNVKEVSLNPNSDVMEKGDVISDHVYKAIPESKYEIEGYDKSVIKNITIVDITDSKDNVNETNIINSVNETNDDNINKMNIVSFKYDE